MAVLIQEGRENNFVIRKRSRASSELGRKACKMVSLRWCHFPQILASQDFFAIHSRLARAIVSTGLPDVLFPVLHCREKAQTRAPPSCSDITTFLA